jgi:hypothetical protein
MRWHFLSHKFGRLALPWTLLLMYAATWATPPGAVRSAAIGLEFSPILLAAINAAVPTGWKLKRLSSPARTFLVMNAAALSAIAVFVLPSSVIWKPTQTK